MTQWITEGDVLSTLLTQSLTHAKQALAQGHSLTPYMLIEDPNACQQRYCRVDLGAVAPANLMPAAQAALVRQAQLSHNYSVIFDSFITINRVTTDAVIVRIMLGGQRYQFAQPYYVSQGQVVFMDRPKCLMRAA